MILRTKRLRTKILKADICQPMVLHVYIVQASILPAKILRANIDFWDSQGWYPPAYGFPYPYFPDQRRDTDQWLQTRLTYTGMQLYHKEFRVPLEKSGNDFVINWTEAFRYFWTSYYTYWLVYLVFTRSSRNECAVGSKKCWKLSTMTSLRRK